MTKPLCSFNRFGYCKFDKDCKHRHVNVICVNVNCEESSCEKRHPKICFKLRDYGRCRFGGECKYDHSKPKDIADLDDKVKETKKKLDRLENKVNLAKLNYGQPKPNSFLRFPVRFPVRFP